MHIPHGWLGQRITCFVCKHTYVAPRAAGAPAISELASAQAGTAGAMAELAAAEKRAGAAARRRPPGGEIVGEPVAAALPAGAARAAAARAFAGGPAGWFIITPSGDIGPFGPSVLKQAARAGKIASTTALRHGPSGKIIPAGRLRGLAELLREGSRPAAAKTAGRAERGGAAARPPGKMRFRCPACGTALTVPMELAGTEGKCSRCRQVINVPRPKPPQAATRKKRTSPPPAAARAPLPQELAALAEARRRAALAQRQAAEARRRAEQARRKAAEAAAAENAELLAEAAELEDADAALKEEADFLDRSLLPVRLPAAGRAAAAPPAGATGAVPAAETAKAPPPPTIEVDEALLAADMTAAEERLLEQASEIEEALLSDETAWADLDEALESPPPEAAENGSAESVGSDRSDRSAGSPPASEAPPAPAGAPAAPAGPDVDEALLADEPGGDDAELFDPAEPLDDLPLGGAASEDGSRN